MRVVGLAGWSGAGKTTLVVRLVPELVRRGISVSTMKHAHHGFDVDQPGKDSYRHREAGATEVLVASDRRWALMHELRDRPAPTAAELMRQMTQVDLGALRDKADIATYSLGSVLSGGDTDSPDNTPASWANAHDECQSWALKRRQARREGQRYGLMEKGVLAPETVRYGGLHVGRFEVTHAQFGEFDKQYEVGPGRENYPASGVTFERARAYCAWLSRATGRRYRLPTAAEADDLYAEPADGDNTLDAWAGYAVNPDDAARLRPKLVELGAGALLREVGAGRAAGDAAVFDLGGNVAEWVTAKDGKGELRGGSADQPADAKRRRDDAAPEYRGFRVVQEGP